MYYFLAGILLMLVGVLYILYRASSTDNPGSDVGPFSGLVRGRSWFTGELDPYREFTDLNPHEHLSPPPHKPAA
jgi:hypothetical protein